MDYFVFWEELKMKRKEITVLKVEPLKKPTVCKLTNELEELQKAVSIGADYTGLIEIIEIGDELGYDGENVCLLCNEEGKLINLPPNRRVGMDIICGVFYITGQNKHGDLDSLSDKAMKYYANHFKKVELINPEEVQGVFKFGFHVY